MDEVSDIVLGEAEQTALKWAMGMPWFERFADPASREAAFGDLCIRLEASGRDAEVDDLRERLQALRKYADEVVVERDRLLAMLDAERAQWAKERDRLRVVVDAYEKAPSEAERWAASRAERSASSYVGAVDTGDDVTVELGRLRTELSQMRTAVDVRAVAELADERDRLRAVVDQLQQIVSFFASVIKSGEPWTSTCEDALRAALDGSADIGGGEQVDEEFTATCPDCGNPLRFCDCPDRQAESWDAAAGEKP